MAELYESPKQYVTAGGQSGTASNAQPSIDSMIESLPPEEREEALKYITAPPTGEEIARAMAEKNVNGEMMNMTLDQYRLFKAYRKTKETDIIETLGEAAGTVFDEISKAAGSIADNPADALKKLTPSVIEAFAQGTRSMYGMAAQSSDPTSVFFKMKNALQGNGDDEMAEFQQFMEAQAFNIHSMRLMSGQDTLIMDKDVINHEMTQVMSYIADPTLFIPFGGIAAKGATLIGMGEKLAMASARAAALKRLVIGGTLKWGVGAPIEFLGTAVRNTIDFGLERGSKVFEVATGMPAAEVKTTAQLYGWTSASAALSGATVPLPVVGDIAGAMVGSTTARGVGEAISTVGEQILKQQDTGRGVLGYAGQALRDSKKNGVVLSKHAEGLLKIIEAVDPLFVYADEITSGAAQGAFIGGTLGYLSAGEEGMAGGIGSGMALGAVGAGAGKLAADVSGNTKMEQMAIQRKLVIEGLKEQGNENAIAYEAIALAAEATGDRVFQAQMDGIIAGIDVVNPDVIVKAFNDKNYTTHLEASGIDPKTGKLREKSSIFPEIGDRRTIADVLSILRDNGGNFAGDPKAFEKAIMTDARYKKLKPIWERLDDNAKSVLLKQIENNSNPDFLKSLKGRQLNAHFGDLAYSERLAEMINTLNEKNPNLVSDKIAEILKQETRSDKKLTRRGQMLKEKLQADGYIDKDGTIRKSRNTDVEVTKEQFKGSAGWTKRRTATGKTEIVINLDVFMKAGNRESMPHEVFHSIMRDSVFAKDYSNRLIQLLVGTYDPKTGQLLEKAVVQPDQLRKFMHGYINSVHRNESEDFRKRRMAEVDASIEDFKKRGDQNRVADASITPLESLVEEFGAYYFAKFILDKPIDFLFRGGEYSGLRAVFETTKESFLDYWRSKIAKNNPSLDFDNIEGYALSRGFGKDGKRAKVTSLDLFMQDVIRMQANLNRGGRFDISNLSPEARKQFIQSHGLRGEGFETLDKQGNLKKKPRLRKYTAEEIRQGKEMYKVLESLSDDDHKGGMRRDGDGNWSGRPNAAQINALVGSGFLQRAWFDRLNFAYNIINGNGPNVVEFGYLGYSAHIGDGPERVYGSAVPFKNRRAILLDVDFKVRADGTTFANFHTLDLRVIEARGNEVWRDPQVRDLWNGDRTSMEADFYAYLSNASLPSGDPNRKPSLRLLDRGDGLGGQRRDALHQMLGFHKGSDLPYINKPIAEIPVGIRHSVTTFSNDGIVALRTDGGKRVNYNHSNAHLDLSRNFMPSELTEEKTPSGGKVLKHATGYKISKQAGEKFKVFSPEGKYLGEHETVADAGRAAQKHFNETFDKSVEGKDAPVPNTEVPPPRQGYIERKLDLANNKELVESVRNGIIEKQNRLKSNKAVQDATREALLKLDKEGLSKDFIETYENIEFEYQGKSKSFKDHIKGIREAFGAEYDAMYPMEIKSALHGRLAQIFQDYPNLTAQGLLKKLVVYGSQGSRMFQEATEIGLVDLLKSKIQRTTSLMRADASEAVRGNPELASFLGNIIRVPRGGETQPKLDMAEILDFAKSKEIKVTIEEGAREVSGMDTSRFTLGGAKANYKQTAVRINPEYAHGVRGHYGENTIVHFRTTERLDADGNRHLFIEEVQANNTDVKNSVDAKKLEKDKQHLPKLEQVLAEGRRTGVFVQQGSGETSFTASAIRAFFSNVETLIATDGIKTIVLNNKELINRALSDDYSIGAFEHIASTQLTSVLQTYYDVVNQRAMEARRHPEGTILREHADAKLREAIVDVEKTLLKHFRQGANLTNAEKLRGAQMAFAFSAIPEFKAMFDELGVLTEKKFLFDAFADKLLGESDSSYGMNPHFLIGEIDDIKTRIQQAKQVETPLPLTASKDWTLTALKGIIRQAIRDGLDKITLTHPDDSPTVSHMDGDARRGLYGKLIPEVWGSWLRKYGIEIKQTNKLADATIDTAKAQMAEITNKLHDANKAVLEHFEQVKSGEDPATINSLAQLMATPVHEANGRIDAKIRVKALDVNDNKLRDLINEVSILKGAELNAYNKVQKLREGGIRGDSDLMSDTDAGISAEAIDRGMTFELNDRIKRDFFDGKIQTHMMPAEGGAEGNAGIPKPRGTVALKEGYVRVYHQTNKENLESIRSGGLRVDKTRPSSESRGVSVSETPFYGDNPNLVTIELQVPKSQWDKANGSALQTDVPASSIIAVHEPWHERVRYIEKNKDVISDVLKGEHDDLLSDPEMGDAIRYIKKKYGNKGTSFMPSEGGADSVATRNKITLDANGVLSKLGMNLKDKTKMEIWMRHLTDDPATALETIREEGLVGWMKNRAQSIIDAEVESFDPAYKELKHQQKVAQQFLDKVESGDIDTTNFMPAEGEQGGRTYTPEQMAGDFVGRYASENRNVIKGKTLQFYKTQKKGYNGGEKYILAVGSKEGNIGHITIEIHGTEAHVEYSHVDILEQGKGYGKLLYSEMVERLRSMGIKDFTGWVTNQDGVPIKIRKTIIDKQNAKVGGVKSKVSAYRGGGRDVESYLEPKAWYMPSEEVPDRNKAFNRIFREIRRNKGNAIKGISQAFLDKFGIQLKDYEDFARTQEAYDKLEWEISEGKHDHKIEFAKEELADLKEKLKEHKDNFDYDSSDRDEDYTFSEVRDDIDAGIKSIKRFVERASNADLSDVDVLSGDNRIDALTRKLLGSGFAQSIGTDDIPVKNAIEEWAGLRFERELGDAFASELYSSSGEYDKSDGEPLNKRGILVDILRSENKLTKEGKPQGEVIPQRIINALRNRAGGDSKVYTEAKAIGLIDWLESKQEGNKQKKVSTKEVIDFVENNKMGLTIDPELAQYADFGDTKGYVSGGSEQAKEGYRVFVVRVTNPKHEHGVSGHFEGAVVHIRVTTRRSKDGKKVFHIEEIQANNTTTGILSDAQKKIVTKELDVWKRLKDEFDYISTVNASEARSIGYASLDPDARKQAEIDKNKRYETNQKKMYEKYSQELLDANPEYWKEKKNEIGFKGSDLEYVEYVLKNHNWDVIISEKKTSLKKVKNNAPLQDPKEWVKVAFRTVLRKALVEGVDRITITPWDETPIQVGMKAKSAEKFYGGTIKETFNSELAKMNAVLSPEGKHESIPRETYNRAKVSTNNAIQKVATDFDAKYAQSKGADVETIFKLLHTDDADLATNHSRKALEDRMTFLLRGVPEDTAGKHELTMALQRKSNQFQDYLDIQDSIAGGKHPSGLDVRASAAGMSSSEYLVDRSLGFDVTPEMKKKAAKPQRIFMPAEGWRDWKSERTSLGSVVKNAVGYVIMVQGDKFKVYNPYKAMIGIYSDLEQAKRRVQRDEPKQ
jgi:hypothetical protein